MSGTPQLSFRPGAIKSNWRSRLGEGTSLPSATFARIHPRHEVLHFILIAPKNLNVDNNLPFTYKGDVAFESVCLFNNSNSFVSRHINCVYPPPKICINAPTNTSNRGPFVLTFRQDFFTV